MYAILIFFPYSFLCLFIHQKQKKKSKWGECINQEENKIAMVKTNVADFTNSLER